MIYIYKLFFLSNEDDVGQGVREENIPRKDVFIVTKVNTEGHGYEQCKQAVATSLKKLVGAPFSCEVTVVY